MPPRRPTTGTRARRIPSKGKLTDQGREQLAKSGIDPDTDSDDSSPVYDPDNPAASAFFADTVDGENIYGPPPVEGEPSIQGQQSGPFITQDATGPRVTGEVIDSAIDPPDRPLIDPDKPLRGAEAIKTTPPSADEWLDFFSRIILKIGMELYVDFAFRGVDESMVSDADVRRMKVRKEERDTIARPFAEFATKNKAMRKHGRQVVALTDSAESLMTLGIWARRVNRIAKKYRPKEQKPQRPQNMRIREAENGNIGSDQGTVTGGNNGRLANGFGVYNPGSG